MVLFLSMVAAQVVAPPPLVRLPTPPPELSAPRSTDVLDSRPERPPAPPSAWIVPKAARGVSVTNMEAVFNEANYPFWADLNALEGVVPFRVAVDAAGRALGCEVTEPTNVADLDRGTCDLLMVQARFAPATDARGRPIAGIYRRTVRWQLENRTPFPVADESIRAVIIRDPVDQLQCRIEASPGAEVDPRMCRAFLLNPALMATMQGIAKEYAGTAKRWELVYHQGALVPGGPAGDGTGIGRGPGERLIDRGGVRLVINEDGKVIECATLETTVEADPSGAETCKAHRLIPYRPGTEGRVLIRMGVNYVRER